jgi:hypothetical protein
MSVSHDTIAHLTQMTTQQCCAVHARELPQPSRHVVECQLVGALALGRRQL